MYSSRYEDIRLQSGYITFQGNANITNYEPMSSSVNQREKKLKRFKPRQTRGGSRISGKGIHIYKGVGFTLSLSLFFLNFP